MTIGGDRRDLRSVALFILRRGFQYVVVLLMAVMLNFALPRLAPGDPLDYLLGEEALQLTRQERIELLAQFELDAPVWQQFTTYLTNLARGELGISVRFGRPVADVIMDRLPLTLALAIPSVLLSSATGIFLGVVAAWRRGRRMDIGSLSAVMFLDSMPFFWLGMVLIGIFSVQLGWLPSFGALPLGGEAGLAFGIGFLKRLILPVSTLTLGTLGAIFVVARYSTVATLREDFILMTEASGLRERRIVFRHALRNSMLPITTVIMLNVGFLLGGVTVVETVFSYPGLGRLMFEGVLARDYPLLQGVFLLLAFVVVIANFAADALYPLLDPRIRRPTRAQVEAGP